VNAIPVSEALGRRSRLRGRIGDRVAAALTFVAALSGIAALVAITYRLVDGARAALTAFGIGFLGHSVWDPVRNVFGAAPFLYGTAVTSAIALLIATPLAIAIGLYLSELAPRRGRWLIGSLVELLAAIPSVVLGLWGILVMGPFLRDHLEPGLKTGLGFLPIFGGDPSASGVLTAGLILAIMVVPIVASVSRELFLSVPTELKEGARALGATRWEVIRGVVLASSRPGIAAAVILGLGRAIGEAIAVTQVIGGADRITRSLFAPGDTIASRIASQFQGAATSLQVSSLFYLATILLVIGIVANLSAQLIVRRFEFQRVGAD
jgi:phosphate transport system permease protein